MITILNIFRSARKVLRTTSSGAEGIWMIVWYSNGIKIIAIVRQYCEDNVLSKEKQRVIFNEHRI